jgi:hypothetical protein
VHCLLVDGIHPDSRTDNQTLQGPRIRKTEGENRYKLVTAVGYHLVTFSEQNIEESEMVRADEDDVRSDDKDDK